MELQNYYKVQYRSLHNLWSLRDFLGYRDCQNGNEIAIRDMHPALFFYPAPFVDNFLQCSQKAGKAQIPIRRHKMVQQHQGRILAAMGASSMFTPSLRTIKSRSKILPASCQTSI